MNTPYPGTRWVIQGIQKKLDTSDTDDLRVDPLTSSECLALTDAVQAKKERPADDKEALFLTHKNIFPTLQFIINKNE